MDRTLERLREALRAAIQYQLDGLHGGQLDADAFQQGIAQDVLTFHTAAYLAGLDSDTLDAQGRQIVIRAVQDQVDFLNGFADAIAAGDLSDDAITARALSYAGSITGTWWQGATDGADLPAYPGDGSSECLGNCGCSWDAQGDGWYWRLGKNDSCATCTDRAQTWAPWQGDA